MYCAETEDGGHEAACKHMTEFVVSSVAITNLPAIISRTIRATSTTLAWPPPSGKRKLGARTSWLRAF